MPVWLIVDQFFSDLPADYFLINIKAVSLKSMCKKIRTAIEDAIYKV